ncbi:MAG: hypothetical protein DYH20_01010 [Gammaproteobacteria bacterium PRO9]|nr:hypothetical protein [Gammaproteobacteria bacterium PRO9]
MARGTQFRELVNMLRAELGQSLQRSTGLNTVEAQKYALKNTYQWLWDSFDWRFLKVYRDESLIPGERYYSFDPDMSYESVERAWTKYGDSWLPVVFGIDPEQQNAVEETRDPVCRWDSHDDDQYEVWPVPASAGTLRMYGIRKYKPLVDEKDKCLLDDLMVVMWTVARLAPRAKAANGQLYVEIAKDRLRRMRAKARGNKSRPFVLGGGAGREPFLRPGLDYMPESH